MALKKTAVKKTASKKKTAKSKVNVQKLDRLVEDTNKKYGKNTLRRGFPKSDENEWYDLKRFSTGIPSLDIALGGGVPIGRYTEIQGPESVGKSTVALNIGREFQIAYPELSAMFTDGEGTTDDWYFENMGWNEEQTLYNPSAGLEESTQLILDQMTPNSDVRLAIIDSIESLTPTKEYEKGMDDTIQMGVKPSLMGEFFRKYNAYNNKLLREGSMPLTVVGLNQLRDKIGGYGYDTEFAPGGRAKNFAQTICIRLRRGDTLTEGTGDKKHIVGHTVKFKVHKNKTYGPGKTGEFDLYTDDPNRAGIKYGWVDVGLSIVLEAMKYGVINRSGAYYYLDSEPDNKFLGRDKMIAYIMEKPELIPQLLEEVMKIVRKR